MNIIKVAEDSMLHLKDNRRNKSVIKYINKIGGCYD
jgi:hypothetical protein